MPGIQVEPKPLCPECECVMRLVKPRRNAVTQFEPFWGCQCWPECEGKREVEEDGLPERMMGEEEVPYD